MSFIVDQFNPSLVISIDADMKSKIGSTRLDLGPYHLRFHVEQAGADGRLIQHEPLGVAYNHGHPISIILFARITAHARVLGLSESSFIYTFFGQSLFHFVCFS